MEVAGTTVDSSGVMNTWALPGEPCYNQYKSKGCHDQALMLRGIAALRFF